MRHEHDGLQRPGLPGAGDGEVVAHEAGVDLAVVHRARVHVGGLRSLRHQLGSGYLGQQFELIRDVNKPSQSFQYPEKA